LPAQLSVWTIGHSTLAIEDFIHLLERCEIQALVDVRSFPGSRRYPQFNKDNLQSSLPANRIEYVHLPELGGRRRARPDSINVSWRNESFRGYADYMETAGFELGISKLLDIAEHRRTAIMCAESLWWRCHRSLISDFLKVKGIEVIHIIAGGKAEPHPYTSAARIVDGELSYRGML
jgi:uncharacterized protein (DUF488 family)